MTAAACKSIIPVSFLPCCLFMWLELWSKSCGFLQIASLSQSQSPSIGNSQKCHQSSWVTEKLNLTPFFNRDWYLKYSKHNWLFTKELREWRLRKTGSFKLSAINFGNHLVIVHHRRLAFWNSIGSSAQSFCKFSKAIPPKKFDWNLAHKAVSELSSHDVHFEFSVKGCALGSRYTCKAVRGMQRKVLVQRKYLINNIWFWYDICHI